MSPPPAILAHPSRVSRIMFFLRNGTMNATQHVLATVHILNPVCTILASDLRSGMTNAKKGG